VRQEHTKYGLKDNKKRIEDAACMVSKGKSIRKAAESTGVPYSTLRDHIKGNVRSHFKGRNPVLSDGDEHIIVDFAKKLAEWGFPLDTATLSLFVKNILDKKGVQEQRFRNNVPGYKWIRKFLRDNKDKITIRKAANISRKRGRINEEDISQYIDRLEETLNGIPPENIVNYDESGLADDTGRRSFIFSRGVKYPEKVQNTSKTSFSVMFSASGAGELLPP